MRPTYLNLFSSVFLPCVTLFFVLGCGSTGETVSPSGSGGNESVQTEPKLTSSAVADEFAKIAKYLKDSDNKYVGTRQLRILRERQKATMPPVDRVRNHVALSQHLLRLGQVDEAIKEIDRAYEMRHENILNYPLHHVLVNRARTYLRLAEIRNCVERHNCDCCIFPLKGGGIHVDREPAEECRKMLLESLEILPSDYTSIWLLNILTMALGEYPDGIPDNYRIPATAFQSENEIGQFRDIAPSLGIDALNLCGGVIVEDFNGDSHLDIVTSTSDPEGQLVYYENQGNGTFSDRSQHSALSEQYGGLNCIGSDYDGDGDVDILVLRGAWMKDHGRIRNSLLRNNGDGTFSDVTKEAGLADPAYPTQAAVWADFNNDSNLDLYVGNECRLEMPTQDGPFPSQLFINQGDGKFVDMATQAGATNDRYAKAVTAGDYDNDGDVDIYVSNVGPNRLYQNQGDGTFEDVATELGMTEPSGRSFATWFFDYDNDGHLDLFVAAYEASVMHIAKYYLDNIHNTANPRLYRNLGNGTFEDVTESMGLNFPCAPMGANFGDLDNDGYLDIYLTTGDPLYQSLMPNIMLRNDAGKRFQDVTTAGGFGHLQKGHGVAFADFDRDGDQDIYHQLGGFFPGDKFHNVLFENPGPSNQFLILKLIGTNSHRSGMGAKIHVVASHNGETRSIYRSVGSVSSFGGSPLQQEIGLGDCDRIERIEVKWPRSDSRQVIKDVELGTFVEITENQGHRVLTYEPVHFKK